MKLTQQKVFRIKLAEWFAAMEDVKNEERVLSPMLMDLLYAEIGEQSWLTHYNVTMEETE